MLARLFQKVTSISPPFPKEKPSVQGLVLQRYFGSPGSFCETGKEY